MNHNILWAHGNVVNEIISLQFTEDPIYFGQIMQDLKEKIAFCQYIKYFEDVCRRLVNLKLANQKQLVLLPKGIDLGHETNRNSHMFPLTCAHGKRPDQTSATKSVVCAPPPV